MAASDLLGQIAPGQSGSIHQDSGSWREVRCDRVSNGAVHLSLLREKGDGQLQLGARTFLQTVFERGVARIEGNLEAIDPKNPGFGIRFKPIAGAVQLTNRREAYRVPASLRAELRGNVHPHEEGLKDHWPCAIKDISVGGVRLILKSPPPNVRTIGLLKLLLPTEETALHLAVKIISSQPGRNPPPMDAIVRGAFYELQPRMEAKLTKYVNWIQVDMIKRGLK